MSATTEPTVRLWDCHIARRPGDPPLFEFACEPDGTLRPVRVCLDGYRIVPRERTGRAHSAPIAGRHLGGGGDEAAVTIRYAGD